MIWELIANVTCAGVPCLPPNACYTSIRYDVPELGICAPPGLNPNNLPHVWVTFDVTTVFFIALWAVLGALSVGVLASLAIIFVCRRRQNVPALANPPFGRFRDSVRAFFRNNSFIFNHI